jgi:hypothetical protein
MVVLVFGKKSGHGREYVLDGMVVCARFVERTRKPAHRGVVCRLIHVALECFFQKRDYFTQKQENSR